MKRLITIILICLLSASAFAGGLQFSKGQWNERIILKAIPGSPDTIVWITPTEKANGVRGYIVSDTAAVGSGIDSLGIEGTTTASNNIYMKFRHLSLADCTMARRASGTPYYVPDIITADGSVDSSVVTLKYTYDLNTDSLNVGTSRPAALMFIYTVTDTTYLYHRMVWGGN